MLKIAVYAEMELSLVQYLSELKKLLIGPVDCLLPSLLPLAYSASRTTRELNSESLWAPVQNIAI